MYSVRQQALIFTPLSFSYLLVSRLATSRSSVTEEPPPSPSRLSTSSSTSDRPSMGVAPLIRERTRSFDDPTRRRLSVKTSGASVRSASSERSSNDETSPSRHSPSDVSAQHSEADVTSFKMANVLPRPITFTTGETRRYCEDFISKLASPTP